MMKTLLLFSVFIGCILVSTAQVGINTTTPDGSAMLDIASTDKGILVPRMTEVQKMAIGTPATSLLVYQTDGTAPGFYYFDGTTWSSLAAAGAEKVDDLTDGITTTNSLFLGENVGATENAGVRKNTSVGILTTQNITTGIENTALGYRALRQITTGSTNTAIGSFALNSTQDGDENVAIGRNSLFSNLSGSNNAAIGGNALYTNATGGFNNAMGSQSLYRNTTGAGNNAVGSSSLFENTTGSDNVAIGKSALSSNTTSSSSVAIGTNALLSSNSASAIPKNTAIGTNSFRSTTSGTNNTGVGYNTGYTNTTGVNNVAIGSEALYNNQSASNIVAVGYSALRNNTSGYNNSAFGANALLSNTEGGGNSAFGKEALTSNIDGTYNTAMGDQSLILNTGDYNTAIGASALSFNTTGASNTAIGLYAFLDNKVGNYNVSVGENSGRYVDGNNNVFIGRRAGANNFISNPSNNKSNNIMIGYEAGLDQLVNDRLFIENSSSANPLIYGEFDNDLVRINGELQVGNPATTGYALPVADGTANYILQTDGSGQLSFINPTTIGDGTGTDDQNLTLPSLIGTTLNLGIESGTGTSIDLAALQDGTGTDDQDIQNLAFNTATNILTVGIENGTSQTVDLTILDGDITGVSAGDGLIGDSASGTVSLDVVANNGITAYVNDIRLGGSLTQATTIVQGNNDMVFNLDGTGDFRVNSNGTTKLVVLDNGDTVLGGDFYMRDENTGGTLLARITDINGDDGALDLYNSDVLTTRINGGGDSYLTGGNLGIGTASPDYNLSVSGTLNLREDIAGGGTALRVNGTEALWFDGSSFSWGFGGTSNFFSDAVGIGINAPAYKLDVREANGGDYVAQIFNTSTNVNADGLKIRVGNLGIPTTSTSYVAFFDGNNTVRGRIQGNGTGVTYNTTSDRRLKTNITNIDNALHLIDKIQPRRYEYKSNLGKLEYGFIAQELQPLYPQAVSGTPDSNLETDPMMVDYARLTPLLTAGIKELAEKVNILETENQKLKIQLLKYEDLEARLNIIENVLGETSSLQQRLDKK